MNKFICGMPGCETITSRKGLREHLKKEHRILTQLANTKNAKQRQNWWKVKEI